MKNNRFIQSLFIFILLFGCSLTAMAQYAASDWKKHEQQAEKKVQEYKEQNPYEPFYVFEVKQIEFTVAEFISHSNATASDMYESSAYEVKAYDELLNKYYKRLMSRMSAEKKEDLRAAQRLWLKFYEKNTANCEKLEQLVNRDTGTLRFPVEQEARASTLKYRAMELGWMISYLKY